MSRVRIAFGLLIVIVGTAWLLGGPEAVRSGGRWALAALPYAFLGVGLLLLLRAAVPRFQLSDAPDPSARHPASPAQP
ncbi:hypothetical protein ACIQPS_21755 [Streptomyces sp. NPDC091290]|uniref:hypothetical protein n=1 Tax=Streptomyces sp. NPDC091290 TaxID=3365990 RepID=UPI0037F807EB